MVCGSGRSAEFEARGWEPGAVVGEAHVAIGVFGICAVESNEVNRSISFLGAACAVLTPGVLPSTDDQNLALGYAVDSLATTRRVQILTAFGFGEFTGD